MKKSHLILVPVFAALLGCQGDPTNAPTAQAVEDANKARIEAIENDTTLTREQKDMMKSRLGGVTGGATGKQGQPPAGMSGN